MIGRAWTQRQPRTGPKAVTLVLVPYNNLERAMTRLQRDLVPSLEHYRTWDFELLVIDNSEQRLEPLAAAVDALPWPSQYVWHDGANRMYGPSLNIAARLAQHPFLIYACTNHGRMHDPRWIQDLILPLWASERVAMTGHPYPSPPASALGFRYSGRCFHIQGGVFAARTATLRSYPYDEGEHAHWGSDIWQSYQLLQEGFELAAVPSVMSVWRKRARRGRWRYVHDESEG